MNTNKLQQIKEMVFSLNKKTKNTNNTFILNRGIKETI